MSTPLTAAYRIEFQYTVSGLLHKLRQYCAVVPSGDSTGYDVVRRVPFTAQGASVAIDQLWTLLAPFYSSTRDAFGVALIEQYSAGAWLPLSFHNTAVTPTGTFAATSFATQQTYTFRDTAFHKVRHINFESFISPPAKFVSLTGLNASILAFLTAYSAAGNAVAGDPFFWVRGRSNLYLNSWVSLVVDTNDKVRRARGLV